MLASARAELTREIHAELMKQSEVDFIGKMILDEVMELFATVLPPAEAKETLKGFIKSSKDIAQLEGEAPAACRFDKFRMLARCRDRGIPYTQPQEVDGSPHARC